MKCILKCNNCIFDIKKHEVDQIDILKKKFMKVYIFMPHDGIEWVENHLVSPVEILFKHGCSRFQSNNPNFAFNGS